MTTFAGAVFLCTALVQKQMPGFDAYVPLNTEGQVSMFGNTAMKFQFQKCMDAHGQALEDVKPGASE